MKKGGLVCLLLILSVFMMPVSTLAATPPPEIMAPAAIMIDLHSQEVVYEKDADTRMYPASTTKIMTALLALEYGNLDKVVSASHVAVNAITADSSKMGLYEGEEVSMRNLLTGLLIASGNDAANVIAEEVCGSIGAFVEKMNERAKALGCENTNFMNTNGLPDENHYTTARDMAKIAHAAMKYPEFVEIVNMEKFVLGPTNKYDQERIFYTTNNLITSVRTNRYRYTPAIGIKTGYTDAAKNCLVAAADLGGVSFISVVLGASIIDDVNYSYVDTIDLFKWGFENYVSKTVAQKDKLIAEKAISYAKGTKTIKLLAKNDQSIVLPVDANELDITVETVLKDKIQAPVLKGDVLGTAEFFYKGEPAAVVELVADTDYEYSTFAMFVEILKSIFTSAWLWIPVIVFALIVIIGRQMRYRRRMQRRRQMMRQRREY